MMRVAGAGRTNRLRLRLRMRILYYVQGGGGASNLDFSSVSVLIEQTDCLFQLLSCQPCI